MKTLIKINLKLTILLDERMIEFKGQFCTILEEKRGHCDLTGEVIQAMAKNTQ